MHNAQLRKHAASGNAHNLSENFVFIGTPLPSLLDSRDDNEFKPLWEQEVRDEKGRKRLHGAFTGGFSAGYFNSVGSKEGWKSESTFKSSRNKRATYNQQSAEMYMDEEDLAEAKASRVIQVADTFDNKQDKVDDKLKDVFAVTSQTIGNTILGNLGWKPGQGIGPRISSKIRRSKFPQAPELGKESEKHTFAPPDCPVHSHSHASRLEAHGLGYSGYTHEDVSRFKLEVKPESRMSLGFGIGLNDAEEDDLDPYAAAMGQGQAGLKEALENQGGLKQKSSRSLSAVHSSKFPSNGTWADGKSLPSGCNLAQTSTALFGIERSSEQSEPPSDWEFDPAQLVLLTQDLKTLKVTEKARSVFEYISNLQKASEQSNSNGISTGRGSQEDCLDQTSKIVVPEISPYQANAALRGFMPFTDDSSKQGRYRSYLTAMANRINYSPITPPGMTIQRLNEELSGFQEAAQVFRPMSDAIASRFTSSSAPSDSSNMTKSANIEGLVPQLPKSKEERPLDKRQAPQSPSLDVKDIAVMNNNFGRMTRTITNCYPVKLLCKRLGIQDPHPDGPALEDREKVGKDAWRDAGLPQFEKTIQIRKLDDAISQQPLKSLPEAEATKPLLGVEISDYIFQAIYGEAAQENDHDEPSTKSVKSKIAIAPPIRHYDAISGQSVDNSTGVASTSALEAEPFYFRPTFISKGKRDNSPPPLDSKEESIKRPSKKSKVRALLTFGQDEDDNAETGNMRVIPKKSHKSKKKMKIQVSGIDDEDDWVEH